jgi:hypothetical protein
MVEEAMKPEDLWELSKQLAALVRALQPDKLLLLDAGTHTIAVKPKPKEETR